MAKVGAASQALAVPELDLLCRRLSILSPASLEVQEVDGSPESLEHTLVASRRRGPRVIGIHNRCAVLKLPWPQADRALAAVPPRNDVSRHGFFIGGPVRDLKEPTPATTTSPTQVKGVRPLPRWAPRLPLLT
jgi:hypothetical protein